jgi:hypothetical protein
MTFGGWTIASLWTLVASVAVACCLCCCPARIAALAAVSGAKEI